MVETACGSVYVLPGSVPERTDGAFAGVSDDGDVLIDEALPAEASGYDCDRDGWPGADEDLIFGEAAHDQDPCGGNGWPADLAGNDNRLTIQDITSFVAPAPSKFDTSPGAVGFNPRWDLVPGPRPGTSWITLEDITALTAGPTAAPPMLGVRAFDGPPCPYPP